MRKTLTALPAIALFLAGCTVTPATNAADAVLAEPVASPVATLARDGAVPQQSPDAYYVDAQATIDAKIAPARVKPCKNVILFIGERLEHPDGSPQPAIYPGPKTRPRPGNPYKLTWEPLPLFRPLSKTLNQ